MPFTKSCHFQIVFFADQSETNITILINTQHYILFLYVRAKHDFDLIFLRLHKFSNLKDTTRKY